MQMSAFDPKRTSGSQWCDSTSTVVVLDKTNSDLCRVAISKTDSTKRII
jgi:hypothetical protein